MEPLYHDADAGVEQNDPNGRDEPVNAVVVPLADVSPTELGQRKHLRIAHALSVDSADDRERARPDRVWRWTVTVQGTCRRPGTIAADRRRDALFTATRFIETAKRIVRFEPPRLGATITHAPCAPATADELPGQHVLCLELRDTDPATIGRLSSTTFTFMPHASNPSVLYEPAPVAAPAAALNARRPLDVAAPALNTRVG